MKHTKRGTGMKRLLKTLWKLLKTALKVALVVLLIWFAISLFEIANRSATVIDKEYSPWNLIVLVCDWFGLA